MMESHNEEKERDGKEDGKGSNDSQDLESDASPTIETHTHTTRLKTGSITLKPVTERKTRLKRLRHCDNKNLKEQLSVSSSNHLQKSDSNGSKAPMKELAMDSELNGSVSSGSEDSPDPLKNGTTSAKNSTASNCEKSKDVITIGQVSEKNPNAKEIDKLEEKIRELVEENFKKDTKDDKEKQQRSDDNVQNKIPHNKDGKSENKPQTIIVTETKSLAQVINNAVRKDMGGSQEGKPTLVIIETKTPTTEMSNMSKSQSVTNTITVETGFGKMNTSSSLTSVPLNSVTLTSSGSLKNLLTSSSNGSAVALTPSVIEDGGMAVEVPSLVVPYLIEYPPSRTISEFLKMLPLNPKELKELEDVNKARTLSNFAASSSSSSATASSNLGSVSNLYNSSYGNPIGRPKTSDRWGAYFESSLGRFFADIGLNMAKEWVQTDLVKSQKRKVDKLGKNSDGEINMNSLMKNLEDSREKNEPYHFPLKKCEHCNFKTESEIVLRNHYSYPHERHMDYRCNFCKFRTRVPQDVRFHMEAEHGVQAKLERPMCFFHCPLCEFEDNSKAKVTKHSFKCQKKFIPERNLLPPPEFDPPAKRPKVYPIIPPGTPMSTANKFGTTLASYSQKSKMSIKPKDSKLSMSSGPYRQLNCVGGNSLGNLYYRSSGNLVYPQQSSRNNASSQSSLFLPSNQPLVVNQMLQSSQQYQSNQIYQVVNNSTQFMPVVGGNLNQLGNSRFTILPTASSNNQSLQGGPTPVALVPNIASSNQPRSVLMGSASQRLQTPKPNISITPVTKSTTSLLQQSRSRLPSPSTSMTKMGVQNSSFVVCEICDGYIKDLEQLRTHMQWIHKVKIHPKMIFNRPPLNCQKCQFRFFTDQGLERHLLGAHGLVTSSMQENANKGQDSGRCTICGKVFQWKLLAHMSKDHSMILKPAHLSYKCTVCAATFGMYKLFETHVYQAHSTVAKRVLDTPDEKKARAPSVVQIARSDVKSLSPPMVHLECSECGERFSKKGNYIHHWEKSHLGACDLKLCRIDKCDKCISRFPGKIPWKEEDGGEFVSDDENSISESELDRIRISKTLVYSSSSATNCSEINIVPICKDKKSTDSTIKEEEESILDMDVETHDADDPAGVDDESDEETALDMEVESHDVEHPSPGSVHTDEDVC